MERLRGRYGSLVGEVLAAAAADPSLARPLTGQATYLGAEAAYAVTHEGARHLEDVLSRRTRLAIETSDGALATAPAVTRVIAPLLGWGPDEVAAELDDWRQQVELREEAAFTVAEDSDAAARADGTPTLLPLP
jgi:glycerol-3-phosphate dehydrogenase